MNIFTGWYTDKVDVYRTEDVLVGHILTQQRVKKGSYSCRIYRSQKGAPLMTDREAKIRSDDVMAVPLGTDIISGDELMITRGGALGITGAARYFAGDVMPYYEPVGGAFNGLAHIEVGLLQDENIGGPEPEPEPDPPVPPDPDPDPDNNNGG